MSTAGRSRPVVLASSSPYRCALLQRLRLPFVAVAPRVDEAPLEGETAAAMVARLAERKARAVAAQYPEAVVIGSDQTAVLDGRPLATPETTGAAVLQLLALRQRRLEFLTGLCVLERDRAEIEVVPYAVQFRALSEAAIADYVAREDPRGCAGGFKAEGLGIALFERMEGSDPTALIGLPLIRLVALLERFGVNVLGSDTVTATAGDA